MRITSDETALGVCFDKVVEISDLRVIARNGRDHVRRSIIDFVQILDFLLPTLHFLHCRLQDGPRSFTRKVIAS